MEREVHAGRLGVGQPGKGAEHMLLGREKDAHVKGLEGAALPGVRRSGCVWVWGWSQRRERTAHVLLDELI